MQEYIDIVIKYWFVFLPLVIAILVVVWLLIRKGYLQEINLFGLKVNFKPERSDKTTYIDNPQKDSPTLQDYDIKFSKTALENISSLSITQENITRLVENEFTHHVNYFKWDLMDYPLPVQDGYIVVLDKIGTTVTFRGVKRADFNELELASLNDLLAIYRRLSRFEYRINKSFTIKPETTIMIVNQHKEIIRRLIRHYELFKKIALPEKERFPALFLRYLSESDKSVDEENKVKGYIRKLPPNSRGFGLNVIAAISALDSLDEIIANEENGLTSQDD